jgi:hypothetical protein
MLIFLLMPLIAISLMPLLSLIIASAID